MLGSCYSFAHHPLIATYTVDKVNRLYRESSQDYGLMGLRYGSGNLSFGVTLMPFSSKFPVFLCH